MIRYSLLAFSLAVTAAAAQPLQFGPAARVAPFTVGAPGRDYQGMVTAHVNGFAAYWQHDGELWSESLSGFPPRPNLATAHSLGVSPDFVAETANGPIILYWDGSASFVRALDVPVSAGTRVGAGTPDGIECNATRCLVSVDAGKTLAVVDTNAQLVSLVPLPVRVQFRVAWATDPNGFLFLLLSDNFENHAISIDNSGSVRIDVPVDQLVFTAATFNGDRYAVFDASKGSLTAFTMPVDGHPSPRKILYPTAPPVPQAVAWNGSEYLLVSEPNPVTTVPEVIPPNALAGVRIGADLTPIGQPFQIAAADGANTATSIAWNGSIFYLAWTHSVGALFTIPQNTAVEGAAISANGDVVARDLLSWGSVPQMLPRIADGAQPVVVWSELDIGSGIATLRCEIAGHAFPVATGYAIDVVPLGEDYLVAWQNAGTTHAAVLTSDQTWTEVALPAIDYGSAAIAANHDHWLIAGTTSGSLITSAISHDGTVSPPKFVAQLPYLLGLASDGDHFFLASRGHDFVLDSSGAPIADKQPHGSAAQVDFAGGVYGALSGLGTLDRYDRDGNFLGSTKYAVSDGFPTLSHVGSRFVIVDDLGPTPLAAIVDADGTLLGRDVPVPDIRIARTGNPTPAAVETRSVTDTWGRPTTALYTETVSIIKTPPHRAVRH